ncbi:Type I restriction enzyme, S subunit [Roseovarius sp. EC-HK134]|uniref:restriction endonuclease subunit S n=1 Tax=unclassified Roseovarius TaxID=2614913 RepID=UPI0012511CE9|nr:MULTISPECIES: restriction endonuclease subunit S [unclassified Roseovarius]VVT33598.1 Type I restriction enzyme, S subunit [Roseovarius sp. EC-HK134]VVT33738.1 Type I restriction enzyme, S subunit [Roseovarius sp. EC-SD190]
MTNFQAVHANPSWPSSRARFLFRPRREKSDPTDIQLTASQAYGVIPQEKYNELSDTRATAALSGTESFIHVEKDDFVISLRTFEGGIERAWYRGCISPAYTVMMASDKVNPDFFQYLLKSAVFIQTLQTAVTGIRDGKSVRYEQFADLVLPVPGLPTQKQIAAFLDRETARIDDLIAKKERLVAVLTDSRFAVISQAVTVGLDPEAKLVNTGSKYIPRIPAGWRVWRLKHLAHAFGGITLGRKLDPEETTYPTPYLRVANVQAGWLNLSDVAEIEATEKERKRYALKLGDVLMNEGGDNDKLGRGAVWNAPLETCITQNHVFFVRPKDIRFSEWISLATNARYARDFFYLHSNQSTNLASISKTNLERFPIAIPPLEEMQQCLVTLSNRLELTEKTASATKLSIDRLREYRASLITAAVTGQIDVETYGKSGTTSATLDQIEEEMQG